MNKVVVWGASGGLGLAIAQFFRQLNYSVYGVSRREQLPEQASAVCQQSFVCDATVQEQVDSVVQQLPEDVWVISTMGSFNSDTPVDYIGHRYLINALEKYGKQRFLMVTSLGCGDSWQYLSMAARNGFGAALREKSLAESWLQSSSLDYTILRPGGLIDGPATNNGQLTQHMEQHGRINRTEVARLSEQLLTDPNSIGQIFQCVDPKAARR